jgi:hypothetical protein
MHNTEHYIGIGFCQPKFYKRSVWLKAKRIMEWLCDNTPYVERYDFGRGCGKYNAKQSISYTDLAKLYDAKGEVIA